MSTDKPIDATQPIDQTEPIAETEPIDETPRTGSVQDTAPLLSAPSTAEAPTQRLAPEPLATELFTPLPRVAVPRPVEALATEPVAAPARPTLRVGTVVWGLVLAVIGAGIIAVAAGARFDLQLAFIGLLALGGIGLLAGSIATGVRHRNR